MERYSELYLGNELSKIRDGFDVLERVIDNSQLVDLNVFVFGVVTDELILSIAKESILNSSEEFFNEDGELTSDEDDIELKEIAVSIPIAGTDSIDSLYGRGVSLVERDITFAYQTGVGEGVRTLSFSTQYKSSSFIRIDSMKYLAIAEGDSELSEYYKQKGDKNSKIKHKVKRDEAAVKEEAPEPIKKQTSLYDPKLAYLLERFLGD